MKVAIIFFSGTSNTEFIAKQFKTEFQDKGIESSLIDIRRKKKINDDYDYFVFAAPIYFDMFPNYFINWVSGNIHNGNKRRCIVVSTQADNMAAGSQELTDLLEDREFEVLIQDFIKMPNNYYVVTSNRLDVDVVVKLKEKSQKKVKGIFEKFINGEKDLREVSKERLQLGKLARTNFNKNSLNWAIKNLTVDYELCVKCGKCLRTVLPEI